MADYKKKKNVRVRATRKPTAAPRGGSGRSAAPEPDSAPSDRHNRIPDSVERELLEEASRIPARDKTPHRDVKEKRKSKPPMKRYQPRRPVVFEDEGEEKRFSVVDGRKLIKRRHRIVSACLIVLLVGLLVAASVFSPVGMSEFLQNGFEKLGSGSGYPILISGDDTLFTTSEYGLTTVVGETTVECYNKSGKQIFSRDHGYNNPALAQSQSRMVVYDRGGTGYSVQNLTKTLYSGDLDKKIYTVAIGRDGTSAFATTSVEYNSELAVYDKSMKNIFNWYSASATLTALSVSDDGQKVAAAASSVSGGAYTSDISIFDLSSNNPIATITLSGSIVVSMERINAKTFLVLCNDQAVILDWSGNQKYVHKADGTLCLAKAVGGSVLFVDKQSENSGNYSISVVNGKFIKTSDFSVNMTMKDAALSGNYLYFLTDNKIITYDRGGNLVSDTDCDFSVSGLTSFGNGKVLEIGLGEINEIDGAANASSGS